MKAFIHRRRLVGGTLASAITAPFRAWAAGGPSIDWLVTPEEVAQSAAQPTQPLLSLKGVGAPQIEVLRPALGDAPVTSPLPIELAFRAAPDAAIDTASFRVLYGALQIDVTQRLLKAVVVRADGLSVERALIPPGRHRLTLQVSDNRRRMGQRELRFTVAAADGAPG